MKLFAWVGIPREVISERGTQFSSDLMGQVHKLVGIKPILCNAIPSSNKREIGTAARRYETYPKEIMSG